LVWEIALPGVRHELAAQRELVAPGELGAIEPAARGELPFGFGRQFFARPLCVSLGIPIGNVNNRMLVEPANRAAWSVGPTPVGAELE
jgi:hypothetical protein